MDLEAPIKVAIAEDHQLFREGVIKLISSDKIEVIIEAVDGKDLISKLEKASTLPDVCLLDINMPRLNGYDTLEKIKSKWNSIRVIALTMHDNEHAILRMLKLGARGYITKEQPASVLRDAIVRIYNLGYYQNELVVKQKVQSLINLDISITDKEKDFLILVCEELTYAQMAKKMSVSPRTVEGYRDSLFKKLGVNTRTALVMFAIRIGLVS